MPPIAEAFVRVRPDLTRFTEELIIGVNAAAAEASAVVPVTISAAAAGGAAAVSAQAAAATEATTALAAAETGLATASQGVIAGQLAIQEVLVTEGEQLSFVAVETSVLATAQTEQAAAAGIAAAAAERAGVANELSAKAARDAAIAARLLERAQAATIKTEAALAAVSEAGAAATTKLATAQLQATAAGVAFRRARVADTLALQTENVALQEAAASNLALAEAEVARTIATVQATRATEVSAARNAFAARGAAATALTFAGLRGAVLAANAAFLAGAAAILALGKAIGAAAAFEQELNVLQATARATAEQMREVSDVARQLGADVSLPAVSAADAAQAITELSKAGLSLEDSLAGARGVLQLATAAQIDNAAATELAASALNAFGLAGDQAVHVADLLAGASIAAQGSISDMGISLQQSAAAARQVGLTLEDTVALLTLLAQNGLRGSDAGTSLRVALLRLVAPTDRANQIIQALGLTIRDAQGNVRPEVFAEFGEAAKSLTPALRDQAAAAIFGQDAFRALSILAREGAVGLNEARDATNQSGLAAELAGARTKGLSGDVAALKSNLETLGITIGGLVIPTLKDLVGDLNTITSAAIKVSGAFSDFVDINIPLLGSLRDRIGDLRKVIGPTGILGPLAPIKLPAAAIRTLTDSFSAQEEVIKRVNKRLEESRSELGKLSSRGLSTTEIRTQIFTLERFLAELTGDFGDAFRNMSDASDRAGADALQILRKRFDEIGDAATRQGQEIGQNLGEGISQGLSESVLAAVNSAKQSLLSLGSSLADQIGQLIDAGPLGQQIENLQNALSTRRRAAQRLGLIEDLEDARRELRIALIDAGPLADKLQELQDMLDRISRRDTRESLASQLRQDQAALRDAQQAFAQTVKVDPTMKRASAEFLEPLQEQVRSTKSAIQQAKLEARIDSINKTIEKRKELFTEDEVGKARRRVAQIQQAIKDFNTEALIADLQATVAAQKETVRKGIADLITQFLQGKKTLKELVRGLGAELQAVGLPGFKLAGTNLGKVMGDAFVAQFNATVAAITQQARGVAPFLPQVPGFPQIDVTTAAEIRATAENTADTVEGIKNLPKRIAAEIAKTQATPPGKK